MNCIEFERLRREAVESRTGRHAAQLESHAAECSRCLRAWENDALLERAILVWKTEMPEAATPESDLTEAVVARVGAVESGRVVEPNRPPIRATQADSSAPRPAPRLVRGPGSRQSAVLLAVAGCALGLLFTLPPIGPFSARSGGSSDVVTGGSNRGDDTRDAARESFAHRGDWNDADWESLHNAPDAYLMWAYEAVADVGLLFPPAGDAASAVESADGVPSVWSQGWEHELKPIGQGVGKALGFLWDVVALDSPPAT